MNNTNWKENQKEDERLIRAYRLGNAKAVEKLLKKYMPFLDHQARSSYCNLDSDDIKQELFLKFLEACQKYRIGQGTFCGYMTRVLSWKRLDVIRAHKRYNERNVFPGDVFYETIVTRRNPVRDAEMKDYLQSLCKKYKFTKRQTEIFLLCMRGEQNRDIGNFLHIPASYVSRVRKRICEKLQKYRKEIKKDII